MIHPLRHSWLIHGDIVTKRGRKQITEFRREEQCEYCPRERLTVVDAVRWETVRRWYRGKNVAMDERTPRDFDFVTSILDGTPNDELRQQILAERNRRHA
jgi:hypothetical protein